MTRKISFDRGPGGELVDVSDDGKTTTYSDGTKHVRPEDGASPERVEPNAVSFDRGPGGERVHVSDDKKTITYSDGTKTIRP
ncbi:hypothetical protein GCM10023088_39550 [Actinomadura verrucosospora]|uniref:hypothetical protein n=1 Tax=Actinomadura verrucosospora TaxID=46165 RepID=UPI0031E5B3BF